MMKITILICFLFAVNSASVSQYTWYLQGSGTSNNLNSIVFINAETGFVCGNGGTILKTTNRGLVWTKLITGIGNGLYSMAYFQGKVWAAGDQSTIMSSTNMGLNWSTYTAVPQRKINDISFDGTQAFCVGDNGFFLKSSNAGLIWINILPPDPANLNCKVGDYMCGSFGTLLKQGPMGTWTRQQVNTTANLYSIIPDFSDGIYVCGSGGTVLKFEDNVWKNLNTGQSSDLKDFAFVNLGFTKIKYCAGASGTLIRSVYSDSMWNSYPLPVSANFNSIHFTNRYNGWMVGNNGTILATYPRENFPVLLDANNISAWYQQNGSFNSYNLNGPGFEWPKNSGKFARYISGLVIGAVVNNDTLVDCSEYGAEFLPGYTDNNFEPQGKDDAAYRIYKLDYGVNNFDRAKWPSSLLQNSNQGAPVYFNEVTGLYEPMDYGTQTMFMRLTDSYVESHSNSCGRTRPLKADIKVTNFVFNSIDELKNVTYSHYEIINRSHYVWNNAFITFYSDDDADDPWVGYVGCDTILDLGYSYNIQTTPFYGNRPPAVGFKLIRGANRFTGNQSDTIKLYAGKYKVLRIGYKLSEMYSFNFFDDDGPGSAEDSYRCMSGLRFRFHGPIITPQGDTTRFYFSGDPESGSGWNMNFASYRRTFTTTGPVTVNPGDTQHIVIAQIIAQGSNNLNSVTKLKEASIIAQNYYDNFFEEVPLNLHEEKTVIVNDYSLSQNFPNPFNSTTLIKFTIPEKNFVSLKIYDLTGRQIASLVNSELTAGSYNYRFETSSYGLASGIYFYVLKTDEFWEARKMILMK